MKKFLYATRAEKTTLAYYKNSNITVEYLLSSKCRLINLFSVKSHNTDQ